MDNQTKIEMARSFGRTLQVQPYEPANFFCSAKAEISIEEFEKVSAELYEMCKKEVEKSISSFITELSVKDIKDWNEKKQELYERASELETIEYESLA